MEPARTDGLEDEYPFWDGGSFSGSTRRGFPFKTVQDFVIFWPN